jgi:hypothetical protein
MSALCALRFRTNEEVVEETDGVDTLLLPILSALKSPLKGPARLLSKNLIQLGPSQI